MSRNFVFAPGEYYHIYSRGFEKSVVFKSEKDFSRFQSSLYLFNSLNSLHISNLLSVKTHKEDSDLYEYERGEVLVDIGCYALLDNHFHLLVKERSDDGKGISKFMQKLMTSYTMYFNKKYNRTGSLFSTSYKAKHVAEDAYLKYLYAYIHLNPKKAMKCKSLKDYRFSSYIDYVCNERIEGKILNTNSFPDYFSSKTDAKDSASLQRWLIECSDITDET